MQFVSFSVLLLVAAASSSIRPVSSPASTDSSAFAGVECACEVPSHCTFPRGVNSTRDEIFAFASFHSTRRALDIMRQYKTTTIALYGVPPKFSAKDLHHWWHDILCPSHAAGVRVVLLTGFPISKILNETLVKKFVAAEAARAKALGLDGVNWDVESKVKSHEVARAYTGLVKKTRDAMAEAIGYAPQVSVDVTYAPNVWERHYDYKGLAELSDFFFVMDYDMLHSSHEAPCSNDPLYHVKSGIQLWIRDYIPENKLILGVPWYGYHFKCDDPLPEPPTKPFPCRNAHCHSMGELVYSKIMEAIQKANATIHWSHAAPGPFVGFYDAKSGHNMQIWFDDARSLRFKYGYAKDVHLRGVGMWQADCVDYSDEKQWMPMWEEISKFVF